MHYTWNYILQPVHSVKILLVGCGGTGTKVLSNLAMMDIALQGLGHPGLHIITMDNDIVEKHNLGRQSFHESEIGLNKAIAITERINRFYSTNYTGIADKFNPTEAVKANIIITAVDNLACRKEVLQYMKLFQAEPNEHRPEYWLDLGNGDNYGQVILGSNQFDIRRKRPALKNFFEVLGDDIKEDLTKPSCSLAESLLHQELFVNSAMAMYGCDLLWKLFRNGRIDYHGLYVNLKTMNIAKIPC